MNKSELRKWLETHSGPQWEEERTRLIEENMDAAMELIRDTITELANELHRAMNEAVAENEIEASLEGMIEFPEVRDLLKRF